jgi:hypothetical protein
VLVTAGTAAGAGFLTLRAAGLDAFFTGALAGFLATFFAPFFAAGLLVFLADFTLPLAVRTAALLSTFALLTFFFLAALFFPLFFADLRDAARFISMLLISCYTDSNTLEG